MICKIANELINFKLLNHSILLNSLKKYEVANTEYDFSMIVNEVESINVYGKLTKITKFYDIFSYNDKTIQYQKNDKTGVYYASIIYDMKETIINILKDDVNAMANQEYLLTQYVFPWFIMKKHQAIWMHGSSICYNNKAILFSAASGVGKSTHTRLWKQYVPGVEYINDDKNIIIFENNEMTLYGNPWSGKHQIDNNIKAPLAAIVFLHQSKENEISKISKKEAFFKILKQVIQPFDKESSNEWNNMTDELLKIPTFELGCNISSEAVMLVKNTLEDFNNENKR